MAVSFETAGNALVQVFEDGRPLLVTDPWLGGTAYYGSWALDHPLTDRQIDNALSSPFVWISHGHPDHLHPPSLARFDRDREILLPDHYHPEIAEGLRADGFRNVRILPFKKWTRLSDGVRVLCVQDENMDAILVIEAGDALIVNQNDAPMCGEEPFFRRLVRRYARSYLLALCAVDADMLNIVDSEGASLAGSPESRKPGAIWALSRRCDRLGVDTYCCSSSQHLYVRADSVWANPYRITWQDMKRYWCARKTKLVEPFVTVHLDDGTIVRSHPTQESDWSAVTNGTAEDDWSERMTEDDWRRLEAFFRRFELLGDALDAVAFTVGGETRRIAVTRAGRGPARPGLREIRFSVPRGSLIDAVGSGYFDDLLIGNFMKTELVSATLYPGFTPVVAKLGGNAKVFTRAERRRFLWHFFRLSPAAFVRYRLRQLWEYRLLDLTKRFFRALGLFSVVRWLRRRLVGFPVR